MSMYRSERPGLSLAIAIPLTWALALAGCSTHRTVQETAAPVVQAPVTPPPQQVASDEAATTDSTDDSIKANGDAPVDRSDPQNPVADAIATLDQLHSGEKPLVSEHGQTAG